MLLMGIGVLLAVVTTLGLIAVAVVNILARHARQDVRVSSRDDAEGGQS
jgi:hypothetical protein